MCCYSCIRWEDIKIKGFSLNAGQIESGKSVTIEFGEEKIETSLEKEKISKESLIDGIEKGSVGFCNGQIVRAWDRYECFKPKFKGTEIDSDSFERFETGYLACWAGEGCPFKDKCYGKSYDPSFV
ncbi:MAG: hypothetical protein SVM80_12740 [Halobacteriota archaeon]|nr:hypothetical protein [Halobacteriota archaeon]